MREQDRNRILVKLDEMDRYLRELGEILPEEDEYHRDLIKRRACEKTIELAIESLMDVAALIVSSERFGLPSDEGSIIDLLVENRVITPDMGEKIKDMKGFRNILVHKYGRLDDRLVYRFLTEDIDDFTRFRDQVNRYLKLP
ncbi:MAG TPA: DUF86 domain-containing protein [Candidatus Altiarchaeales archaeon]|nr:MAG: hypothetical protein DRO89_06050 [Candidatus Altiarchaeales archaeon]HDH41881.1 DUF86 domain-containing protein [Candidatus Altiarchaeales archaeon]